MSANPLRELQSSFQDYILGYDDRALTAVESTEALSAERRLNIYHNAYRARLVELLADTYERVFIYLGDDMFETVSRAFIEDNPPTARMLRNYGGGFPAYLNDHYSNDPDVAELAAMDLHLRNAFDAVDAAALQIADLACIAPEDWDSVVFSLHPTATFLRFCWNTPEVWQHLADEKAPPPATPLPQPINWIFWRKELQPHYRSLSEPEFFALQAVRAGVSFGTLCAQLAERDPELDVATEIALWLRAWIDEGLLHQLAVA